MLRFLFVLAFSFLAALPSFAECDLRSVWRGTNVSSYVPKAQACLENPGEEIWFDEAVEAEIFQLVNEERTKRDLAPLILRPDLLAPARIHSFDMAQEKFFAHEGADGRTVGDRVAALDRTLVLSEIRENIARFGGDLNYEDIGRLMHQGLMDSEGHRKNILAPNVTHMAIGLARQEKGAWVTQVFARVEGALSEPLGTAISVEAPIEIDAELSDWELRAFALEDAAGNEIGLGGTNVDFRKDLGLVVIGQRQLDERRTSIIRLKGPLTSPQP